MAELSKKKYSVEDVNKYINNLLSNDYFLKNIDVCGEISNLKYHSSGHVYFSLKDEKSVLNCVMFRSNVAKLKKKLCDGDLVICNGDINVYEAGGRYQLYVKSVSDDGKGNLYEKFEKLKHELEEKGMFSEIYKKEIPKYALNIGICTSSTGAAIQDIINISKRRNPFVNLYLYSALVQGEGAAEDIVRGIRYLNTLDYIDVIIIGRGGGSIEDLWAFNEEIVANAIFESEKPVISAVGHEIDFTIADFVSDLRAPTPSAAAELAVFSYEKFINDISGFEDKINGSFLSKLDLYKEKVKKYENIVEANSPKNKLEYNKKYTKNLFESLNNNLENKIQLTKTKTEKYLRDIEVIQNKKFSDVKHKYEIILKELEGASPLNKMKNGFSYIADKDNKNLKSISQVNLNDEMTIYVADGVIKGTVKEKKGINYG